MQEEVLGALAVTGAVVQRTFPFEACDIYITAKMGGVDVLWLVALQVGRGGAALRSGRGVRISTIVLWASTAEPSPAACPSAG